MKKIFTLNTLRIISLVALAVGAGESFTLTLNTGHNNKSMLLVIFFVVWVLSPFAAILAAHAVFSIRLTKIRITLYCLMLVISLISLLAYSGILSPPGAKPASVFLITPLLLWVLMLIFIPIALSRSRKDKNS
ncbi:MAG: hypothetical protein ACHQIM_10635 [Sphingobacteriales bacterium]